MAKKIVFVSNFWLKMLNFDPFLTGRPSHSSQGKFGLALELDIEIVVFVYPVGPFTMKKGQIWVRIAQEKNIYA